MKPERIEIVAKAFGFEHSYGVFSILPYADTYRPKTEWRCPKDNVAPAHTSQLYKCPTCGDTWTNWNAKSPSGAYMTPYIKETNISYDGPTLEPDRPAKDPPPRKAYISTMPRTKFAEQEGDAAYDRPYGLIPVDNNKVGISEAAKNLMKLVIAVDRLDTVITLNWVEGKVEQKVLLTVSMSNRILLQPVIPSNLLVVKETVMVDTTKINEEDLVQAKAFISALPVATEDTFVAHDFRAKGVDYASKVSEKAVALEKILAQQGLAAVPTPAQSATATTKA